MRFRTPALALLFATRFPALADALDVMLLVGFVQTLGKCAAWSVPQHPQHLPHRFPLIL